MQIFGQIEDAVLSRLSVLDLKTLAVYAGQMDVKDISDITINFPCVYIIPRGMDFEIGNQVNVGKYRLSFIVGDMNLRGSKTAVDGDADSTGIYAILQGIYEQLHDWLPVPGSMTPLKLEKIDVIDYNPTIDVCIYAMDFTADLYYAVTEI